MNIYFIMAIDNACFLSDSDDNGGLSTVHNMGDTSDYSIDDIFENICNTAYDNNICVSDIENLFTYFNLTYSNGVI